MLKRHFVVVSLTVSLSQLGTLAAFAGETQSSSYGQTLNQTQAETDNNSYGQTQSQTQASTKNEQMAKTQSSTQAETKNPDGFGEKPKVVPTVTTTQKQTVKTVAPIKATKKKTAAKRWRTQYWNRSK